VPASRAERDLGGGGADTPGDPALPAGGGWAVADDTADLLRDDRRLVARVLAGDDAAFEELVRTHHGRIVRVAGRFFRRADVVEEIEQEVFVKAYVGLARYRGEVPLAHWLARITVNACYDQLRRQRARPEVAFSQLGDGRAEDVILGIAREGGDGAAFWRREEARLAAEQVLDRLPAADRLVLTLTVLEGLSVAEAAALTGWSVANVKVRAFRARNRLRRLVGLGGTGGR
jgi:RNA polymerase sigma-70 factor, ECF subfamily